jgi:hypothetical protein
MENFLPIELVREIAVTYRGLCAAWWNQDRRTESIDPPFLEVRLQLALEALGQHAEMLPEGFETWLEKEVQHTLDVHGEVVADLLLASFTDEVVHGIAWLSRGGSC